MSEFIVFAVPIVIWAMFCFVVWAVIDSRIMLAQVLEQLRYMNADPEDEDAA